MPGSWPAGVLRSRRLRKVAANPRGAIYGTIVATAVIAATARHESPPIVLLTTIATLFLFWLAHVYADVLDLQLREPKLEEGGLVGHGSGTLDAGVPGGVDSVS